MHPHPAEYRRIEPKGELLDEKDGMERLAVGRRVTRRRRGQQSIGRLKRRDVCGTEFGRSSLEDHCGSRRMHRGCRQPGFGGIDLASIPRRRFPGCIAGLA